MLFFTKQPPREEPWTERAWFYDLRTNQHFTLKRNRLTRDDLHPFVGEYRVEDRSQRVESERFRSFGYDGLIAREQVDLDITWLEDDTHVDADDLPDPDVLAAEIIEDLRAALAERSVQRDICDSRRTRTRGRAGSSPRDGWAR